MKVEDLFKKRRSLRAFSDKPIASEDLKSILEAGRLAPSAANRQPWRFLAITKEKGREVLRSAYDRKWFATAPCYLVIWVDHTQSWHRASDQKDHADIDAAIAAMQMCLQATALDIASCMVCAFDTELLKKAFSAPESCEPVMVLALGYPLHEDAFDDTVKVRKAFDEVTFFETFESAIEE